MIADVLNHSQIHCLPVCRPTTPLFNTSFDTSDQKKKIPIGIFLETLIHSIIQSQSFIQGGFSCNVMTVPQLACLRVKSSRPQPTITLGTLPAFFWMERSTGLGVYVLPCWHWIDWLCLLSLAHTFKITYIGNKCHTVPTTQMSWLGEPGLKKALGSLVFQGVMEGMRIEDWCF